MRVFLNGSGEAIYQGSSVRWLLFQRSTTRSQLSPGGFSALGFVILGLVRRTLKRDVKRDRCSMNGMGVTQHANAFSGTSSRYIA